MACTAYKRRINSLKYEVHINNRIHLKIQFAAKKTQLVSSVTKINRLMLKKINVVHSENQNNRHK
jgi:hypothetical protein